MIIGQSNFLQSLGWTVLNSLWQMALLWVIYQFITAVFRTAKSSFRCLLASILPMTGFAWFIFTFISVFSSQADNTRFILPASVIPVTNFQFGNWLQNTLPVASVVYLVLLLLPAAHFIRNYRYVKIIRQSGLTKIDVHWRIFIKNVAGQIGIKKPVHIWISEFVSSPVTIGYLKPVILVPLAAINHLSVPQMEAVLLHELSHIRRYDYLVNLIINFIQTILYFNPFVKAFVKIVEREREKSCDEMVLQFQYDSHEYATALLALEKTNHDYRPLSLAAAGKKNDLLQRVELIMGIQKKSVFTFNKLLGLMAGLLCLIVLNALLVNSKPLNERASGLFAGLSSPFNLFTESGFRPKEIIAADKEQTVKPGNIYSKNEMKLSDLASPAVSAIPAININPDYLQAVSEQAVIPQLKKYQEEQVKATISASKKVFENAEWKALERNIADVLSQKEKEELKTTYLEKFKKFNWNKWENKLRLAYDKVNWNQVNEQLAKEVNNIRIDSLQRVYTDVICKLDMTSQKLSLNHLSGIPDTDITLNTIEESKQQAQKTLNRLKAVRSKKIIHL